jgi:serine/threonine protein kinase
MSLGEKKVVYYIATDLALYGDLLSSYLDKITSIQGQVNMEPMTTEIQESRARFFFKKIVKALKKMHDIGLVHRDMKPENILVKQNGDIVLADYALAAAKKGKFGMGVHYSKVGTEKYMSPELNLSKPYRGDLADVYASGVILFLLATETFPFVIASDKNDELYQYIATNQMNQFWDKWGKIHSRSHSEFSDSFKDLVTSMLAFEVGQRIKLDKVLTHPWINSKEVPETSTGEILVILNQINPEVKEAEEDYESVNPFQLVKNQSTETKYLQIE